MLRIRNLCEDKGGDGFPDEVVLAEAMRLNRILLTYNVKHFRRLSNVCQWHSGIIACSENRTEHPDVVAKQIDAILRQHGQLGMRGRFERLLRTKPSGARLEDDEQA